MKKTLLIIAFIFGMVSVAESQIEIYETGTTTDIAGSGVNINAWAGGEYHHDFYIINNTGSLKNWNVTRVRINEIASWSDYLCWGPEGGFGNCYSASSMDMISWASPSGDVAVTAVGDTAKLSSYITPDYTVSSSATYRYYVGTTANPKMDSVDVTLFFTLGLDEISNSPSISVAPNPTSESFTIQTENMNPSSIKVVDVLGNVLLISKFNGVNKTVNVANFSNGVYFVIVEAEDTKPKTKRIVVRH